MSKKPRGISIQLPLYKSYMFRDKDPAIDELRTAVEDEYGARIEKTLKDIHDGGGPSMTAMRGWFFGDTRRPMNATIEAAGRAAGLRRVWIKNNEPRAKKRR